MNVQKRRSHQFDVTVELRVLPKNPTMLCVRQLLKTFRHQLDTYNTLRNT